MSKVLAKLARDGSDLERRLLTFMEDLSCGIHESEARGVKAFEYDAWCKAANKAVLNVCPFGTEEHSEWETIRTDFAGDGGADNNLDYLEVVHVLIRRPHSSSQALYKTRETHRSVSGNKNDTNDAAAIAEARSRESTKYVPINTEAQQDLQMLHRARQALIQERTAMICRIRAFAGEYGQVFALGVAKFLKGVTAWLADPENGLSGSALTTFAELKTQLDDKDARIAVYDERLTRAAQEDERAKKLMVMPGVGKLTATAVLAAVSDAHHFNNGRDFAANLGLVPREHSSGGKQCLFGITKRGDTYLRTLLIHGARSALQWAGEKPDKMLRWATKLAERRSFKVAVVALANKMARVIWAILAHGREYVPVWSKA